MEKDKNCSPGCKGAKKNRKERTEKHTEKKYG